MSQYTLYHFEGCSACAHLEAPLRAFPFEVERRDIHENEEWLQELVAGTGKRTVPALQVRSALGEVTWVIDARKIMRYLSKTAASIRITL